MEQRIAIATDKRHKSESKFDRIIRAEGQRNHEIRRESTLKNKNEELLCENAELDVKYEKVVHITGTLPKQLLSKVQNVIVT